MEASAWTTAHVPVHQGSLAHTVKMVGNLHNIISLTAVDRGSQV